MEYLAALILLGSVFSWFAGDTAIDRENMVLPLYDQQQHEESPPPGEALHRPRPAAVVMLQGGNAQQRPLRQWGVEAIARALPEGVSSGSPTTYLWREGPYKWEKQWRSWALEHGVEIIIPVSIDQQVDLGPYPFMRPIQGHTLVDVAAIDVATGQVLFRAAGTDRNEDFSRLRPRQVALLEEQDRGLEAALKQVVAQLPQAPVLQADGERVAHPVTTTPSLSAPPLPVLYGERHPRVSIEWSQFNEKDSSRQGLYLPAVVWDGVTVQGTLPLVKGVGDWVPVLAGRLYRMGVVGHASNSLTGGEARLGAGFEEGDIQLVLGGGYFAEQVAREGLGGWRRSGASLFFELGLGEWDVTWQRRDGQGWGWGLGYQWRY